MIYVCVVGRKGTGFRALLAGSIQLVTAEQCIANYWLATASPTVAGETTWYIKLDGEKDYGTGRMMTHEPIAPGKRLFKYGDLDGTPFHPSMVTDCGPEEATSCTTAGEQVPSEG